MVKNGTVCIVACLLFLSAGQANDVKVHSALDSLIRVALERNPDIRAAEHKLRALEYQAKYAGWLPDPQFAVSALNLPRVSLGLDETPMSGISLGLTQSVPWPGRLSAQADIADLTSENQALDIAAGRNRVTRLVTSGYYDYSYWTLAEGLLAEDLKLIQNIIDVAEVSYANGLGSAQDVLRSQTARARLENRIIVARQRRSSALVQLGRLTDDPETVHASLAATLPAVSSGVSDTQ